MEGFVMVDGRVVYPRSGKKKGSKHVKLTVGRNCLTGGQIQHDYTGKTAEEIQEKIEASRCLSDGQLHLVPEEVTLERLMQEYIRMKSLHVENRTYTDMEKMFQIRIQPYFAGRDVRTIRPEEIRAWQETLLQEGRRNNYVNQAFVFLQAAMEYGYGKGYLHCNPCRYARMVKKEAIEQHIPDECQLRTVLVTYRDHPMAGIFAIMLLLGLRIHEALGLSWKQIDFERKTVCISQQASRKRKIIPYTKTKRNRTLMMPESAILYLRREAKEQRWMAKMNPEWENPEELVFTDGQGKMYNSTKVTKVFSQMTEECGGEKITPHSLRRMAASILTETVSMHAAQYYMGHNEGRTTLKYVYPDRKDEEHMIQIMAAYYDARQEEAGWLDEGGEGA